MSAAGDPPEDPLSQSAEAITEPGSLAKAGLFARPLVIHDYFEREDRFRGSRCGSRSSRGRSDGSATDPEDDPEGEHAEQLLLHGQTAKQRKTLRRDLKKYMGWLVKTEKDLKAKISVTGQRHQAQKQKTEARIAQYRRHMELAISVKLEECLHLRCRVHESQVQGFTNALALVKGKLAAASSALEELESNGVVWLPQDFIEPVKRSLQAESLQSVDAETQVLENRYKSACREFKLLRKSSSREVRRMSRAARIRKAVLAFHEAMHRSPGALRIPSLSKDRPHRRQSSHVPFARLAEDIQGTSPGTPPPTTSSTTVSSSHNPSEWSRRSTLNSPSNLHSPSATGTSDMMAMARQDTEDEPLTPMPASHVTSIFGLEDGDHPAGLSFDTLGQYEAEAMEEEPASRISRGMRGMSINSAQTSDSPLPHLGNDGLSDYSEVVDGGDGSSGSGDVESTRAASLTTAPVLAVNSTALPSSTSDDTAPTPRSRVDSLMRADSSRNAPAPSTTATGTATSADVNCDYQPRREEELAFARLLLDERTHEGRLFADWIPTLESLLREKPERRLEDQISAWLDHFCDQFRRKNKVPHHLADSLQLLLQRVLFPRLSHVVLLLDSVELGHQIAVYEKQIPWLRQLTPHQLGVSPDFLPEEYVSQQRQLRQIQRQQEAQRLAGLAPESMVGDSHHHPHPTAIDSPGAASMPTAHGNRLSAPYKGPYWECIEMLEDLLQLSAPLDMMSCVMAASRQVYRMAAEYHRKYKVQQQLHARDEQEHKGVAPGSLSQVPNGGDKHSPKSDEDLVESLRSNAVAEIQREKARTSNSGNQDEAATLSGALPSDLLDDDITREMGADSFFPIWLYIVIQARVPDICRRLFLMQTFTKERLNERGYYLTCLEGALMHILDARADQPDSPFAALGKDEPLQL